ncbi:hypothetical protein [Oleidesulfovibrio sp.]|uniref:hypothetical protein n=1 Tax=Oleidesulfovibrio sp. TaxID=2909707 RepID=UPI003A8BCB31
MRNIFIICLLVIVASSAFAADFVSPIGFEPTESNKSAVIAYVQESVRNEYAVLGINSESALRMMEEENLRAFKKLLTAEDKEVLSRVIKQYCGIGMCNYVTINMMYEEEMKAKNTQLEW